jgi:hypothetical protein
MLCGLDNACAIFFEMAGFHGLNVCTVHSSSMEAGPYVNTF